MKHIIVKHLLELYMKELSREDKYDPSGILNLSMDVREEFINLEVFPTFDDYDNYIIALDNDFDDQIELFNKLAQDTMHKYELEVIKTIKVLMAPHIMLWPEHVDIIAK